MIVVGSIRSKRFVFRFRDVLPSLSFAAGDKIEGGEITKPRDRKEIKRGETKRAFSYKVRVISRDFARLVGEQ